MEGGENNTLSCNTDLSTCCGGAQGLDRGYWYFPNGSRLISGAFNNIMFEGRGPKSVSMQYSGSGGTSGIYRCDIETIAVNDNDGHETVYVGLYTSEGEQHQLIIMDLKIIKM